MQITKIKISDIDATKRIRPVDGDVADQLADSIQVRGLRQPIEVAEQLRGKKYRLISGGHRFAACAQLEMAAIPAIVISGDALQLRADELLENLERSELSPLERAEFYAELKLVFQEANPDAKHGGDRTKEQESKLADWYETIIDRTGDSESTIKRAVRIGQKLAPKAKDALRGTPLEHNQSELEALSKQEPGTQVKVAKALTSDAEDRPKSVSQAVKVIEGHAEPVETDPVTAAFNKLMDTWNRNDNAKARRLFLEQLIEEGNLAAGCIKGVK